MPRKRAQQSDDDYSDLSDEAYEPEASQAPARRDKKQQKKIVKKRRRTSSIVEDVSKSSERDTSSAGSMNSHRVSVHNITDPEPLRNALLGWYVGVHASRGMPWRKPYDPSLNDEQRSQRAYEVSVSIHSPFSFR